MASFEITGGNKLHGEILPQGAKNEALQILCATLLTPVQCKPWQEPMCFLVPYQIL